MKLTWKDSEDIGLALLKHRAGDPSRAGILEAIQMAWYEEHRDQ